MDADQRSLINHFSDLIGKVLHRWCGDYAQPGNFVIVFEIVRGGRR